MDMTKPNENENTSAKTQRNASVKKKHRWVKHLIVAVLILGCGFAGMVALVKSRKQVEKQERPYLAPLVSTIKATSEDVRVTVSGFGTVEPRTEAKIVPQVSGEVVECHANLVNGGFFEANQALIKIDQRDYQAAVNTAEAAVATAKLALEQEMEEAAIAKKEWQQLNPGEKPTSDLVFRGPQIEKAKAELKSAEAKLETAKLNLERTVISMPFNGRVADESIDIGQYVTPGQSLGSVYGTDVVEIVVPLEDKDMAWIVVPTATQGACSMVDVKAEFAGKQWHWQGKAARTQGTIDPVSRMVKVVVEVEKPFAQDGDKPALVPGMFVEAAINGKAINGVIKLPRHVVHNSDEVWTVKDGVLRINKVTIVRNDYEYSYVSGGVGDGDIIVTSPMDAVTDGMAIRTEIANSK